MTCSCLVLTCCVPMLVQSGQGKEPQRKQHRSQQRPNCAEREVSGRQNQQQQHTQQVVAMSHGRQGPYTQPTDAHTTSSTSFKTLPTATASTSKPLQGTSPQTAGHDSVRTTGTSGVQGAPKLWGHSPMPTANGLHKAPATVSSSICTEGQKAASKPGWTAGSHDPKHGNPHVPMYGQKNVSQSTKPASAQLHVATPAGATPSSSAGNRGEQPEGAPQIKALTGQSANPWAQPNKVLAAVQSTSSASARPKHAASGQQRHQPAPSTSPSPAPAAAQVSPKAAAPKAMQAPLHTANAGSMPASPAAPVSEGRAEGAGAAPAPHVAPLSPLSPGAGGSSWAAKLAATRQQDER